MEVLNYRTFVQIKFSILFSVYDKNKDSKIFENNQKCLLVFFSKTDNEIENLNCTKHLEFVKSIHDVVKIIKMITVH